MPAACAPTQTKGNSMTRVTTRSAASEPAATPNSNGGKTNEKVFERVRREQPDTRRPQGPQHHRVIDPETLARGHRAAKHQGSGDESDRARAAQRQHQVADDMVDRIEGVLDAHGGDRGEGVGQRLDKRRFLRRRAAVGKSQRRDVGVRRAAEGAGREHQHEIDAKALPIDGAQIGNAGRHIAAEHIDGDGIAELEVQVLRRPVFKGDEGRSGIVGGPPLSGDEA